ncbi:MAG: hypothetical protein IJS65_05070 [Clostridia bacterium]|nr:hypothetical protein [Clostridia bacterium]
MKKATAWLLCAIITCSLMAGFVFAIDTQDDITGQWGNVKATLTVEDGTATVALSGAGEVATDVSIIIVAYNEAKKMVAVKNATGSAATVKSASIAVPDGAVLVKAFIINEDNVPLVANQIWNA